MFIEEKHSLGLKERNDVYCIFSVVLLVSFAYQSIIDKYYSPGSALHQLLIWHSSDVARKALSICDRHLELRIDRSFIYQSAMLHDIGIFLTDAPNIHCLGKEPYIRHGILGAGLLKQENLPLCYARICERHTGTGITKEDILKQALPLPFQDFLPETIEEKLICYADKFFSKSHPKQERTLDQAVKSLEKFGQEGVNRFLLWAKMFE